MFIEVTRRAEAVEVLRRGAFLWCRETGEGKQLGDPASWSKRALRRFVARYYRDARYWSDQDIIHFGYRDDGE